MTNWSFEHVTETRAALRTIVSDPAYGPTALSNVRIMSEVLPRLLRGARLERSVLVTAAKESLASTMLKQVSEGMDPSLAVRLSANFLAAISPVPLEACYWVSAELALALGLITVEQANALGSTGAVAPAGAWVPDSDSGAVTEAPPGNDEGAEPIPQYGQPGSVQPSSVQPSSVQPSSVQPSSVQPSSVPPGPQPTQVVQLPATVAGYAPGPGGGQPGHGYDGQAVQPGPDDWVSRAVRDAVRPGLLAFNTPQEMQQGRIERVEVAVARSPELRDALTAGFRGRGLPEVVRVNTSPVMGVELRGPSFEIVGYSPPSNWWRSRPDGNSTSRRSGQAARR